NGDGKLDVLVACAGGNDVNVLLGNGNGTLQAPVAFAVGSGPVALALGDFDGDGRVDLVTANAPAQSVTVLFGDGAGSFGGRADVPVGDSVAAVAVGDLDGDGTLDVVSNVSSSGKLVLLRGDGHGSFTLTLAGDLAAATTGPGAGGRTPIVADLDGDGR